jgi:putative DNA primase/helicase
MAAEDSLEDTTIPRLEAAGADLRRVHLLMATRIQDGSERTFDLQADLELLERKIAEIGDVSLVCIDPITSYLGNVDSHKNADLRRVLEPIGRMAERARVGIVSNTHFAKPNGNGARALHRFIGSIAFVAAARMAFIAVEDPDDSDRNLFLEAKNNLASQQQGLAYRKLQRLVGPQSDIVASYIDWDREPVSMTADEALGSGGHSDPTAKDDAIEFLRTVLTVGSMSVRKIEIEARLAGHLTADQAISQSKPFRAARRELGVQTTKSGMDGGWEWSLPKVPSNLRAPSGVRAPLGRKSRWMTDANYMIRLRADLRVGGRPTR